MSAAAGLWSPLPVWRTLEARPEGVFSASAGAAWTSDGVSGMLDVAVSAWAVAVIARASPAADGMMARKDFDMKFIGLRLDVLDRSVNAANAEGVSAGPRQRWVHGNTGIRTSP